MWPAASSDCEPVQGPLDEVMALALPPVTPTHRRKHPASGRVKGEGEVEANAVPTASRDEHNRGHGGMTRKECWCAWSEAQQCGARGKQ